MPDGICIEELHEKDDIMSALKMLGGSLFNQRINTVDELEKLADKYSHHADMLVIKDDGRIIGLCAYYSNDRVKYNAFISMLVIEGSRQGNGYGRMLLSEVTGRCIDKNMKHLAAEVSDKNIRAVRLYEKIGFRISEKRDDSLIFIRDISQTPEDQGR